MAGENDEIEFDMEKASSELGEELFGSAEENDASQTDLVDDVKDDANSEATDASETSELEAAPTDQTESTDENLSESESETDQISEPEAPKTWRKEAASAWKDLPKVVKDEIAKRESDMFSGIESYKADAGVGKAVKQIIEPFMPLLNHHRIDPGQHIHSLLETHQVLTLGSPEQKVAVLQNIAQQFGVDIAALSAEPAYVDPQVASLQSEVQQLRQTQTQYQQTLQEQRTNEVTAQIEAFSKDPQNVYFDEVLPEMTTLLRQGVAKDLRDAYNQAIWLNPSVRQKELDRQAAEKLTQQREKVEKAKKATSANTRAQARPVNSTAPVGSMDETIESTLAAIKARDS